MLPHGLLPDKRIFIGPGFDLCSVHEQVFTADFSGFQKDSGQLAEEILANFFQKVSAESGDRAVVGALLPAKSHMKLISRRHACSIFLLE